MPDHDRSLQAFLADRDTPCPGCGYNLRGLTAGTCPECNQELRLAVGLVEPRLGLWVTAVIGAALGLGFNFLLMIYVVIQLFFRVAMGRFMDTFVIHNGVGLLVQGALLLVLLRGGRRIRRWGPWLRAGLALLAWVLSLVNVVVFSVLVR